jgi:hypothetical protein
MKIEEPEEELANRQTWEPRIVLRDYCSYKDSDKEFFFNLYDKGMSLRKAATELSMQE